MGPASWSSHLNVDPSSRGQLSATADLCRSAASSLPKCKWEVHAVTLSSEIKRLSAPASGVFHAGVPSGASELAPRAAELLRLYRDVFPDELPDGLPPSREVDHKIELTPGAVPPSRPTIRLSATELAELKKQLDELVAAGFIQPEQVAVRRSDPVRQEEGRHHAHVRRLPRAEQHHHQEQYPLPRVDELFDRLQGAKFFSKIDLRSGYHQIRIDAEDVPKTAFRTRYGHFEFLVLPFGLTNAPATFMHLMHETFREFLDDFVLVFLDDILIYSKTLEEHERHVRRCWTSCAQQKLYAKESKCEFFKTEVEFLGHIVGRDGVRMMEDKVQAVSEWPTPTKVGDVRAFLGTAGYYRKFIRDFSAIAAPLTELTKDAVKFDWGAAQQAAFDKLKAAIAARPRARSARPRAAVRRAHRRLRIRHRRRAAAGPGQGTAADRLPVEEDAAMPRRATRCTSRSCCHHPRARGVAPLPAAARSSR